MRTRGARPQPGRRRAPPARGRRAPKPRCVHGSTSSSTDCASAPTPTASVTSCRPAPAASSTSRACSRTSPTVLLLDEPAGRRRATRGRGARPAAGARCATSSTPRCSWSSTTSGCSATSPTASWPSTRAGSSPTGSPHAVLDRSRRHQRLPRRLTPPGPAAVRDHRARASSPPPPRACSSRSSIAGASRCASAASAGAARPRPAGPLTFDQAKAQGKEVDWGPNCDTTTGKVAVPSGYAPPCVAAVEGRGQRRRRPRRASPPTRSPSRCTRRSPTSCSRRSSRTPAATRAWPRSARPPRTTSTTSPSHYELYGRKVKLVTIKASGAARRRRRGEGRRDQGRDRAARVRVVRRPGPDHRVRRRARGARRALRG